MTEPLNKAGADIQTGNPHAKEDGQLVIQTLAGDKVAFDRLVGRYQRQAVSVSFRLLGNSQDAMEVVQEAFLKSYKSLHTLQKPEAFGGWLMRIVSNLSLNARRGRKNRSQLPIDDMMDSNESFDLNGGGDTTDPIRLLQGKELGGKLKQALGMLPEKQKMALLMFTIDGLPQKDIAEALDCTVEAVKWHVFQARKRLREMLKDVI